MTIDQLSNLIKDPNIFGYLIVRPFGLMGRPFSSCAENGENSPKTAGKPAKRAIAAL